MFRIFLPYIYDRWRTGGLVKHLKIMKNPEPEFLEDQPTVRADRRRPAILIQFLSYLLATPATTPL
jgi:hypothetical protein